MEREVPEEEGVPADRGDTDTPSEEDFFQRLGSFPNLFFQRCVEKANRGKLKSTLRALTDKQKRRQGGAARDLDDEEDPKNLTIFLQWLLAGDEAPEEKAGKKKSRDRAEAETEAERAEAETKAERTEAETKAERAARENPRSLLALSNQAYILWHNGQTRPALQLLEALEGLRQEASFQDLETEAQSEVLYLYIRLDHLFNVYAISELQEQLLDRRPHDDRIKFTLGQTLRRYANDSHIRNYSSTEHLIPAVRRAIQLFVEIKENGDNSPDLRARAAAQLGEMLYWQEEERLRSFVEQERSRLKLSATRCFQEAVELGGDNPAVLVCAGKYFRTEKELQRSRKLLEKAVEVRPEPKAHHQLGMTFRQMALEENSASPLRHRGSGSRQENWRSRPGDGDNWRSRPGDEDNWRSRPGDGENWRSRPGDGENWRSRPGVGENWRSRPGDGDNWRSRPGDGDNWRSRPGDGDNRRSRPGDHVLSIDDPFVQEAMRHFGEALKLSDEDNFAALFSLGDMYYSLQKYEQALDHFEKSCEQSPALSFQFIKSFRGIGLTLAEMKGDQPEYSQEMSQFCLHFNLISQCWLELQSQGGTPVKREARFWFHSLQSALQQQQPTTLTRAEGAFRRNLRYLSSKLPVLRDISSYDEQSAINSEFLETAVQDYLSEDCFHDALLLLCLLKLTPQSLLMNTWQDADILRKTLVRTAKHRLYKSAGKNDTVSKINTMAARILFHIALEASFTGVAVTESSDQVQTSPSLGASSQERSLSSLADRPAGHPEFPQPQLDDSPKETLHVLLVHDMEASGDVRTIQSVLRDVCGLRTSLLKKGQGGRPTPLAHNMEEAQLTVFLVENSDISSEFEEHIKKATTTASSAAAMMSGGACAPGNPSDQSASSSSSARRVTLLFMNSATLPPDLCQGHLSFALTSAQLRVVQEGSRSEAGVCACCHLFCSLLEIEIE